MHSFLRLILFVLTIVGTMGKDDTDTVTCTMDPNTCVVTFSDDKEIDLSPIEKPLKYQFTDADGHSFYYNPCKAFKCKDTESSTESLACYYQTNNKKGKVIVPRDAKFSCSFDKESLPVLSYTPPTQIQKTTTTTASSVIGAAGDSSGNDDNPKKPSSAQNEKAAAGVEATGGDKPTGVPKATVRLRCDPDGHSDSHLTVKQPESTEKPWVLELHSPHACMKTPVRPTTESPQPPTTEAPQPPTTEAPQPPTTAEPKPKTTTTGRASSMTSYLSLSSLAFAALAITKILKV